MISTTRREALMGVLAMPAFAAIPQIRWTKDSVLLVYDPALEAGLRFALRGEERGSQVLAIRGDRIRFGRALFERRPALIAGVSRHADALLIHEVAREAGYARVVVIEGQNGRCDETACGADWQALGRIVSTAGGEWVEALADATRAGEFTESSVAP